MNDRHPLAMLGLVLLLAAPLEAAAGCSISSPGMAFGIYQPLTFAGKLTSTAVTSNVAISVACSNIVTGGSYTISLGPSSVGSGDRINTRYMANSNGGDPMAYNIYRDAALLTVWGDGSMGQLLGGDIPVGSSNRSHTVYGRVLPGQNTLRAGSFSDALVMTLNYIP